MARDYATESGMFGVIDPETRLNRAKIEAAEKWRDWIDQIPSLHFNPEWEVKIIPPFAGAMIRFEVRNNGKWISAYLDAHSQLGCMWDKDDNLVPYWEIYPNEHDDIDRFYLDETDKMMAKIAELLNAGGKSDES